MANLSQYTQAFVYVNGSLLSEEASVTIDRDTRAQEVMTTAKGFAGYSPGAPIIKIDVESAVPAAGFEYQPDTAMVGLQVVQLTIYAAGKTLITSGFILSDNFNHAVNSASKLKFSGVFQFVPWA